MSVITVFLPVLSPTIRFSFTRCRLALWRIATLPGTTSRFAGWNPVCGWHLSDITHACMPDLPTETANLEIGEFLPLFVGEQFIQVNQDQQFVVAAGYALDVLGTFIVTHIGRGLHF